MCVLKRPTTCMLLVACILTSGCVKKSTHQAALGNLADARADLLSRGEYIDSLERQRNLEAAERRAEEATLRERIAELELEVALLDRQRSEAEGYFEEARNEVHRLEVILSERGTEYRRLQQRLESLRSIEREVRERNQIYEDVLGRFRSLIDGGQLSVAITRGRMVIQLPQDILFESGSATLAQAGRRTLAEVGAVLAELGDRSFQVEGHTDNVPIATERFPSNWELSTARALSVVRILVEVGVEPERLSGAGYGEYQPVAPNDDRESRRRNRRIEIVMLPNLDVIAGAQLPG